MGIIIIMLVSVVFIYSVWVWGKWCGYKEAFHRGHSNGKNMVMDMMRINHEDLKKKKKV